MINYITFEQDGSIEATSKEYPVTKTSLKRLRGHRFGGIQVWGVLEFTTLENFQMLEEFLESTMGCMSVGGRPITDGPLEFFIEEEKPRRYNYNLKVHSEFQLRIVLGALNQFVKG